MIPKQIDVPVKQKDPGGGGKLLLDAFVDFAFRFVDQPLLPSQSNFAPVEELKEAVPVTDLVEGVIPDDFSEGVYIRNGPNPLFGGLKSTESIFGKTNHIWMRFGKVNKDLSNTGVVCHGGKFYSVAENHAAQEFDILGLDARGEWDINGAWDRPFTAHPKKAPGTGELVIFGMQPFKPFIELGIVSADGERLLHKVDLDLDRCALVHDIGVTERYNVIMDFPLTIDLSRLLTGGQLINYDKEGYARIGVMPRYGNTESIRWFDVAPNCTFHILNCFEDGNEVVVRACRCLNSVLTVTGSEMGEDRFDWFSRRFRFRRGNVGDDGGSSSSSGDELFFTRCYEWRLNMKTGEVKERNLTGETEASMDFPVIHPGFTGLPNRFGYTQTIDVEASSTSGKPKFGGLAKLYFQDQPKTNSIDPDDDECGDAIKVEYHELEKNTFCSGAAFVPKLSSCEEDDGWIVAFVHNEDTDTSKVYIIDAKKFSSQPVAKITLPCRVPYGFHGAFVPMSLPLML
ncbi:unnamed protein product [Linum tenue]|uniref:Uncharacterized protein n=1 Tax=Linum tenue TaxID=586396 RepID=A0AAV0M3Q0_9ROSI|nr:unnamed protein product [Linum tenue]